MIGRSILLFLLGYLSGSIPWGYIVVRLKKGIDIRTVGSGNIGATNVYRVLGLKWALLVFILDAAKGALPVWFFAQYTSGPLFYILSFSPFIGHCYTLWLRGRGGKGVATSAGILLVIAPFSFLIALIVWLFMVLVVKVSSAGSLLAALVLPLATYFIYDTPRVIFTVVLSIWVILRHKENIRRLLEGKEKTERL